MNKHHNTLGLLDAHTHEHSNETGEDQCDLAPDGLPWIVREPNRTTPHAENGWRYHYPL